MTHMRAATRWTVVAATALLAVAASLWGGFWRQDNAIYDQLVARWRYPPDPSLVLVAIDDRSLQALGPARDIATPTRLAALYGVDAARVAAALPASGARP